MASGPWLRVQRQTRASRVALPLAVVLVIVAATVPFWGSSNIMKVSVTFLTLLALAQMWNLLAGFAGLISVGQQAYIGLGAYSLLVMADNLHVNPFIAVFIAGLIAGVIALPTSVLAFRLRGGYFAVGTWVIAEVYRLLLINNNQVGGGSGVTIKAAGHIKRATREHYTYWLALFVAVAAVALVYFLLRSRLGLALTAIRDDETGADSLGVNVGRAKRWVYLISSAGCGLTGAVIYLNLLRIQPDAAFSVNYSALMIFTVVIGGVGTIEGPIIGTIVFFTLQQTLSQYGSWYLILLGAIAALTTVWAKRGIWGFVKKRWGLELFPVRRRVRIEEGVSPLEQAALRRAEAEAPAAAAGDSPKV